MNPLALRILMVIGALGCLVAAYFLADQRQILVPAALGLLGWSAPAPGHGAGPTSPALALLLMGSLALSVDVACSSTPMPVTPAERVKIELYGLREACNAYKDSGQAGPAEVLAACDLFTAPALDQAPTSDGGGGR